ncbi:hypothetical protein C5S31_10425 [ANME-1 cluster archaeon GoMg2]|nr:hypothetical protein [ANME-1 cluster archaeon GoMg2]
MKKRILIVGACGFAGSKIYEILANNFNVIGTCRTGQHNGYKKFDVINECEMDKLIESISPDIIIYASAITDVDYCEMNPSLANLVNAHSIRLISKKNKSKLIYLSTDYVFDGKKGTYSERDCPNPVNKYGLSKLNRNFDHF